MRRRSSQRIPGRRAEQSKGKHRAEPFTSQASLEQGQTRPHQPSAFELGKTEFEADSCGQTVCWWDPRGRPR